MYYDIWAVPDSVQKRLSVEAEKQICRGYRLDLQEVSKLRIQSFLIHNILPPNKWGSLHMYKEVSRLCVRCQ